MLDFWREILGVIVGTVLYAPEYFAVFLVWLAVGLWFRFQKLDDRKAIGKKILLWLGIVYFFWVFVCGHVILSAKFASQSVRMSVEQAHLNKR